MTRFFQIVVASLMVAAAPPAPDRGKPPPATPQRETARGEVPGIVLVGMGTAGLAIVGFSARRRRPGRSVTN